MIDDLSQQLIHGLDTSRQSDIVAVYQPIVELRTRRLVGYEALARRRDGDADSAAGIFTSADTSAVRNNLDWACRTAAFDGAMAAGLSRDITLFVNVEPTTTELEPSDARAIASLACARHRLRVVLEVTERSLLDHPATALRLVSWARKQGWGTAVDDIGAYPDSLAMLPFIAPDVVKLDLSLVQRLPDGAQARALTAVMAHAERSGAVILAEGVETEDHLEQALALGAALGQGYLLGKPGPIDCPGRR